MNLAVFVPVVTDDGPAVAVHLPDPLPDLLHIALANAGQDPAPSMPLATVPSTSDLFATLEAEMAADRLAEAHRQRRADADAVTAFLLSQADPSGLHVLIPSSDAQALFETLNAAYVAHRRAELALDNLPVQVGQPESAETILGLDQLVAGEADDDEETESAGSVTLVTLVLAHLVSLLLDALTQLPATD